MFDILRRITELMFLGATAAIPPSVASVETSDGMRITLSAKPNNPIGKAEYDLSVVIEAADGRRLGPIQSGSDHCGFRRTNLYRTAEGCLVFATSLNYLAVVPETMTEAKRGECTVIPEEFSPDCPDPAFDPATRAERTLGDGTGYLGVFEFNMWRPTPDSERAWLWQFHHAGDEPECLRNPGG